MKKEHYSVYPFWDAGAMKPDGASRIMLTINLNRKQFRTTIPLRSNRSDFDKAVSGKGGQDNIRQLRKDIQSYISKAEDIFERLPQINKPAFLQLFKSDSNYSVSGKTDVYDLFRIKRDLMLKEKRFGRPTISGQPGIPLKALGKSCT